MKFEFIACKQLSDFPFRMQREQGRSSLHLFLSCVHVRQAVDALVLVANRRACLISLPEGNKESIIDMRSKVETFATFPSMPAMPVVLVDHVSAAADIILLQFFLFNLRGILIIY